MANVLPRRRVVSPRAISQAAAVILILLGVVVLVGWVFDLPLLKSIVPNGITMKANSALTFVLAGTALLFIQRDPPGGQLRLVLLLAVAILAISGLTLLEYGLGWDLGLDQLLFREPRILPVTPFPGRMALITALGFLLTGSALLLLVRSRTALLIQGLALGVGLIGLLSIIEYVYNVPVSTGLIFYTQRPIHTSLGFIIVSFGLLYAVPHKGLMRFVTSTSAGGMLARRLLPVAVVIPLALGWLRLLGQRDGFYGLEFGLALFTISNIIVFTILIWWTASILYERDAVLAQVAATGELNERMLAGMIASASDAIISVNADQRILVFNAAAEHMFECRAADAIGQPLDRFIPARFRAAHAHHIGHFGQTGVTTRSMGPLQTLVGLRANGEEFPIEANISQVDTAGQTLYTVILRDITERKQAEETLRLSEANYRDLITQAADGIWVMDEEARLVEVNTTACVMLGYSRDELIGRDVRDLVVAEERREPAMNLKILRAGHIVRNERRFQRKDGSIFMTENSAKLLANGHIQVIIRDVTARNEATLALQLRARQQEAVAALGQQALQTRDLIALFTEAVTILAQTLEIEFAQVQELLPDGSAFLPHARFDPAGILGPLAPMSTAHSQAGYTLESGHPVVLTDLRREIGFPLSDQLRQAGVLSGVSVPIHGPARPYGVLSMHSVRAGQFGLVEIDFLQAVANVLAVAIERRHTEEALQLSLERFSRAFRAIPDGLAMTRMADGLIIEVNERWSDLVGYSSAEVVGRPTSEFTLWLRLNERQEVRALLQAQGFLRDYETVLQDRLGHLLDVLVSIEMLEIGGERMMLLILRDITARKQADAELRLRARQQETVARLGQRALTAPALDLLLVEAVTLAAAGLDAEFGALSELTPDGQNLLVRSVVGWPVEYVGQRRMPVDDTTQAGFTLLQNQPVVLDDEHPHPNFGISPIARERGIINAISVVVPGPERPFGVLLVHSTRRRTFTEHDVQFLHSIGNVLAAALEREYTVAARAERDAATLANQAKNDFLSRMSHELRTPLNAILGFGQLLELAELLPRQQESVGYILKAGQHLLGLINEVLDISRIEAGQLGISPEPVLLRDVLQESLDLVAPLTTHRQVHLTHANLATATAYVLADRQRLKQVLLNLLSNAIKYNRLGGMVYVSWEEQSTGQMRITVYDTGRGIPPELLPRLFTPFERLGAEHTGEEGTGLGLALSLRLMEAMGGRLGLESTTEQGSAFWLELPQVAAPLSPPVPPPAPNALAIVVGPDRTMLFIDDNLSNLRLVESILEVRPNIKLLSALQGRLGLELAQQHRPDLILLDLQLPDLPGEIVLRRLLDDPATASIPVIILSADATPGQITRLRQAGATDYMTKPFRVQAFLTMIDQLLYSDDSIHD